MPQFVWPFTPNGLAAPAPTRPDPAPAPSESGRRPTNGAATFDAAAGEVRERPNRTVSKTVELQGSVGSNPTLSATSIKNETPTRNSPRQPAGAVAFLGERGPDDPGDATSLQRDHAGDGPLDETTEGLPIRAPSRCPGRDASREDAQYCVGGNR